MFLANKAFLRETFFDETETLVGVGGLDTRGVEKSVA